jgi:hypothetical protein
MRHEKIIACACGSTEFDVSESYVHTASIDPDEPGVLHCKAGSDGGVDAILCSLCGAPAPDGLELEFN